MTDAPEFRVARGNPSAEEVAAVVAVLVGLSFSDGDAGAASAPVSAWADPAARLRRPVHHGPGNWRRSALPH
jgi:Acyl-CoA carboxylase epsilon subunit